MFQVSESGANAVKPPSSHLISLGLVVALAGELTPQQEMPGQWAVGFDHPDPATIPGCPPPGPSSPPYRFNPLHMSVIPVGPHQGKLLVWDISGDNSCVTTNPSDPPNPALWKWHQRWAIVDPETQAIQPYVWEIAVFPGVTTGTHNLFCAGHAWLPDGRLLAAGGDDWSPASHGGYKASPIAAIFDPTQTGGGNPGGTWSLVPSPTTLQIPRWYPTVVQLADAQNTFLVAGGVEDWGNQPGDRALKTYEAFRSQTGAWDRTSSSGSWPPGVWDGPGLGSGLSLFFYPRMHLVSERALNMMGARVFTAGMDEESAHLDHPNAPGVWPTPFYPQCPSPTTNTVSIREEGSSVLFPNLTAGNQDQILLIGGEIDDIVTNDVLILDAKHANPVWTPLTSMNKVRKFPNPVLMPDGSIMVLGGSLTPCYGSLLCHAHGHTNEVPQKNPEVFKDGYWTVLAPESSARTYHSCAVLLPSGRVLTGGGDTRTVDYQVFTPPYLLTGNPRPQWNPASLPAATMSYGQIYWFGYQGLAFGTSIASVALLSPASVTHSRDPNMRYVRLEMESEGDGTVSVVGPANKTYAPPGYYMLFMMASTGVPSVARWVRLQ